MKSLIASTIVAATLFFSFASQADDVVIRSADLPNRTMDADHFTDLRIQNARIAIDETNRIVRLTVTGSRKLGMRCMAMIPSCMSNLREEIIELPIISETQTRCGMRSVTALVDQRPVDGILEQIVIREYIVSRDPRCLARVVPQFRTTVEYTTSFYDRINGGQKTNVSTLKGGPLKLARPQILPAITR